MIKISVIVSCYNQEKYIAECLDSVLASIFDDYEIVIVNDGSTDKSLSIINSYIKEYENIRLINQSNQGVIMARNNAIKEAKGEFIFPLDGDDKIAPTCLEKMYEVIKEGIFDVVYSQTHFFGSKQGLFELALPDKINMYNGNLVVCSALYKKEDWSLYGGYDINMDKGLEDWEFWLNFIETGKEFFRIDEPLFFYRQHSISRNGSIYKDIKKELVKYIKSKHRKLEKFQPVICTPLHKKILLALEKCFISKRNYKKRKENAKKYIFDYKNKKNPKLIMTLLVKNEEHIIEQNLIFHKAQGIDGFIVTDNLSTDNTRKILEKYKKKGWILSIIDEKSQDYSQTNWVNKMVVLARKKYQADWIINADADEFWCSKTGNLKDGLNEKTNKIFVPIYNMLSENENWIDNIQKIVNPLPQNIIVKLQREEKLSKFSQFGKSIPKVVVRASDYKMICMGNHNAEMAIPMPKTISDMVQIYHYNLRGNNHFKEKMITGGKAFERNLTLGKDVGTHWRYYYEGFKNGTINLDEEYLKSNGYYIKNEIKEYHLTQIDSTIKDFFNKGEK